MHNMWNWSEYFAGSFLQTSDFISKLVLCLHLQSFEGTYVSTCKTLWALAFIEKAVSCTAAFLPSAPSCWLRFMLYKLYCVLYYVSFYVILCLPRRLWLRSGDPRFKMLKQSPLLIDSACQRSDCVLIGYKGRADMNVFLPNSNA